MRVCKAFRHVVNGCWLLQDFKTVLRGHGGTKDPLTLKTLVMILRHKDLPHGRFKATAKGISDITYPDRKVRSTFPGVTNLPLDMAQGQSQQLCA